MKDLELLPQDDLLKELASRFDCLIIAGYGKRKKVEGNYIFTHYEGDRYTAYGLCKALKDVIQQGMDVVRDSEHIPTEEL